ncbi:MAG: hypothetical protein B0W54_22840 [Cellvibrio sp. 79]|nr:MAG: hypothetical protein B0W54_22840 [Cellvibrio sp. 79]
MRPKKLRQLIDGESHQRETRNQGAINCAPTDQQLFNAGQQLFKKVNAKFHLALGGQSDDNARLLR